jgi:hypothetical protein
MDRETWPYGLSTVNPLNGIRGTSFWEGKSVVEPEGDVASGGYWGSRSDPFFISKFERFAAGSRSAGSGSYGAGYARATADTGRSGGH